MLVPALLVLLGGPALTTGGGLFIRGDMNADHALDLRDAVGILSHLFLLDPETLDCEDAADVNDDGQADIADPIALLFTSSPTGCPLPSPTRPAAPIPPRTPWAASVSGSAARVSSSIALE